MTQRKEQMTEEKPCFTMECITKVFPGVKALDKVSFEIKSGEVHALVGENGAGKSTLMKILGGLYTPDEGRVYYQNVAIEGLSPKHIQDLGVSVIYQELNLCHNLSVAANIFLGRERFSPATRMIDNTFLFEEASRYLEMLGAHIDPREQVSGLSVAERQLVEIAKALSCESQVIIMDEPTSSLTSHETDRLLGVIRNLKECGKAIVFISHRLEEVAQVADTVTVLKDGIHVGTHPIYALDIPTIVSMMVGREVTHEYTDRPVSLTGREPLLSVALLSSGTAFCDVSFELYPGEILGFSGIVGAGRTELAEALFGLRPITSGKVYVKGREVTISSPKEAIRNGIGMLTEDRKRLSLFPNFRTRENVTISSLGESLSLCHVDAQKERGIARRFADMLNIKPPDPEFMTVNMSGGNQQKVVLARALATDPDILIMDEPTKGIDVGAKAEIYEIARNLADTGKAILCISSELLEVLGLCDRILVMCKGTIMGEFKNSEATEEKIMALAI